MTDLLVTNLSGVNLALPAPLSGFLTYNQSKLFNNVDVNAVMQSARVGELVNVKKWLRLQWSHDPLTFALQDVPVAANVIARVVANDDSAVAYLRQGVQFKLLLDANVQVDGSQAHELYVGGVLQSSTLNYPAEVVFGVSLTTPAGLAVLKLYVGGRLSGWATVVVQPQNGFLANT